jgi:hypothetical protein
MRYSLITGFVGFSLLAGCGPQLRDNPGYMFKETPVTLAQKYDDTFECKVAAAQAIPTDKYTSRTPTYTTPVSCNRFGYTTSCTGGNTYGGNLITKDLNEDLRVEHKDRCMAKKGYKVTPFPIPECDPKKVNISFSAASKIHKPKPGACWVSAGKSVALIILPERQ